MNTLYNFKGNKDIPSIEEHLDIIPTEDGHCIVKIGLVIKLLMDVCKRQFL